MVDIRADISAPKGISATDVLGGTKDSLAAAILSTESKVSILGRSSGAIVARPGGRPISFQVFSASPEEDESAFVVMWFSLSKTKKKPGLAADDISRASVSNYDFILLAVQRFLEAKSVGQ
jgi:hypothetical protein